MIGLYRFWPTLRDMNTLQGTVLFIIVWLISWQKIFCWQKTCISLAWAISEDWNIVDYTFDIGRAAKAANTRFVKVIQVIDSYSAYPSDDVLGIHLFHNVPLPVWPLHRYRITRCNVQRQTHMGVNILPKVGNVVYFFFTLRVDT